MKSLLLAARAALLGAAGIAPASTVGAALLAALVLAAAPAARAEVVIDAAFNDQPLGPVGTQSFVDRPMRLPNFIIRNPLTRADVVTAAGGLANQPLLLDALNVPGGEPGLVAVSFAPLHDVFPTRAQFTTGAFVASWDSVAGVAPAGRGPAVAVVGITDSLPAVWGLDYQPSGRFSVHDASTPGTFEFVMLDTAYTPGVSDHFDLHFDLDTDAYALFINDSAVRSGMLAEPGHFSHLVFEAWNGSSLAVDNIKVTLVPEPVSLALLGLTGLALLGRRRGRTPDAVRGGGAVWRATELDRREGTMESVFRRGRASRAARPGRLCVPLAAFAAVAMLAAPAPAQRAPSFQGLGDLSGDYFFSAASAVSADGSVVVGNSRSAAGDEAFLWTREGGMRPLGGLYPADGGVRSSATAVSADGTVVVGSSSHGNGTDGRAFRWTAAGGMQSLGVVDHPANSGDGNVNSVALGVSADGSIVVGQSGSPYGAVEPFRWTASGGIRPLVNSGQPRVGGAAYAISADGSTVVGSSANMPFRWTAPGGLETLEHPGLREGIAAGRAVSGDGSVVVGWFPTIEHDEGEFSFEDFRWTREGGLQVIRKENDAPRGRELALSVSADGSVVLGADGFKATLWTKAGGVRLLGDVLTRDYGLDLSGWTLEAGFISADGSTIAGRGVNPLGRDEAFVAVIPEPSSVLTAIAFTLIYPLRRPKRAVR